jgi:hypothetical protein
MGNGGDGVNVITSRQPPRGELLGQLPLLDYSVQFPRSMTRRQWRGSGYFVKRREEPLYQAWQEEARYYRNEWHPGLVGVYRKDQCETFQEFHTKRQEREASEAASESEWERLSDMTALAKLKSATRRLYLFLHEKAKAAGTDTVITNGGELMSACGIGRNDLKGYREELVQHGLISHRLMAGRQSVIGINALSRATAMSK